MNQTNYLVALVLAGLITIFGICFGSTPSAQAPAEPPKEGWRQEQEQKYQERWEYLERENQKTTGERFREAEQKRRDAEKGQRDAGRSLRELEEQGN